MIDKLFADIDRARAEALVDYEAGVKNIPLPLKSTGPTPHPAAVRLGRIVLIVVLASVLIQAITGFELRPLLVAALLVPLGARSASLLGLLPADLYRPNSWRNVASRALFLAWYIVVTIWPVLLALTIPVFVILRRRSVHNLTLWAMKWRGRSTSRIGSRPTRK